MAAPPVWAIMLGVGLAIAVLAALVIVLPFVPVPSGNKTVGDGNFAYFQVNSIGLPQGISVSWTHGTSNLTVWIEDCGSVEPVATALSPCPSPTHGPKTGVGSSGTLTFTANGGDWVAVGTGGGNASISLRTTDAQGGIGALVLSGAILFLAYRTYARRTREPKHEKTEGPSPEAKPDENAAEEPEAHDAEETPASTEVAEKADGTR